MPSSIKSLATAARDLPLDQQAELIDELVVNLSRADPDWDKAWAREAGRRWADHIASGHPGHAAEDVLADVAVHLSKKRRRS